MNKSEQCEVQKVVNTCRTNPHYAAATLATLLRSAGPRATFVKLVQLKNELGLGQYMEVVNGCYVAKQPTA
jgi:hypothetical protein